MTEKCNRIPFNRPAITGYERRNIDRVMTSGKFSGDGEYSEKCNDWLTNHFSIPAAFVTSSGTHALEMAAIMCDLEPGDEVILPSYTFTSTATAFVRCGAKLVFVDIEPATMNVNVEAVARAITSKTKVVVAVHYAGFSCDMEALSAMADSNGLILVEDAAQAMFASFKGKRLGTFGRFGCVSFHESKNIHCGEGGSFLCRDQNDVTRAEIILEKGTDRKKLFRGEVDKYTWRDIGSSYVLSEFNSAFLFAQLEHGRLITADRMQTWCAYLDGLKPLVEAELIEVSDISEGSRHNAHIFWMKAKDFKQRERLILHLKNAGIHAVFHYQPLHASRAGKCYGEFRGQDLTTTKDSQRILRLPLFFGFNQVARVIDAVHDFYRSN